MSSLSRVVTAETAESSTRGVGVQAETTVQKAVAHGHVVEVQVFGVTGSAERCGFVVDRPAWLEGHAKAQHGHSEPFARALQWPGAAG